jgi:hypothetical protein
MQAFLRWMFCGLLLLDANDHSCPYDHPRAHNPSMPHHHSMPHNNPMRNNGSGDLQELLLSCRFHRNPEACKSHVRNNIWMLCFNMLLDHHNTSSSSHHHSLPYYHACSHDYTTYLCNTCLSEANGDQANASKDPLQGHRSGRL